MIFNEHGLCALPMQGTVGDLEKNNTKINKNAKVLFRVH